MTTTYGQDPYGYRQSARIIKELLSGAPTSVQFAVYEYADGHIECARLLCELCQGCSSAAAVELLVCRDPHEDGKQLYERLARKMGLHGE